MKAVCIWHNEVLPFTFSHPAAVLPIPRGRLSLSAMMIGAMAPDFLYFLLLSHSTHYGHSLQGMFLFSLPAGMAVLWLYHRLFKRPLLALAPDSVARRITESDLRFSFLPATRFAWLAASTMIGVFSHVLWDAFTHESGLFVTMAPELKLYFGLHMPLYSFLQFASTVVGAAFLAWAFWRWMKRTPIEPEAAVPQFTLAIRTLVVVVGVVGILAFALPYGLRFARSAHPGDWWSVLIVKSIIAGITAGFVELLVYSAAWYLRKEKVPELELGD